MIFGLSNGMEIAGHTLVWHSQTPNRAFAGIFRAFVKHRDTVKRVTLWGVNDTVSWRAQGKPLLFDGDSKSKPAFDAMSAEAMKVSK